VAYSTDIAKILTDQLTKFTTLNRHQLAGQAANLDFWLAEVRHCLDVIDGYARRFDRMKKAQGKHVSLHHTVEFDLDEPCDIRDTAAPPTRVPHRELQGSRRDLCEATYRLLLRCFKEGLMDASAVRRDCDRLGIGVDAADLRSR
jgi:hypothetical protein